MEMGIKIFHLIPKYKNCLLNLKIKGRDMLPHAFLV